MSFKKEFDKIVEDLVGDISEPEPFEIEPWPIENKEWYQEAKAAYDETNNYDLMKMEYQFHQRVNNLYKKYEKRTTADDDFINCFCEKKIHECYQCHKSFIIYTYTEPRARRRLWPRVERELYEIQDYKYNTYGCLYCGMPFDVVNGRVLRIELIAADLEEIRRQERN
jgi:hypothetical protein